MAVDRNHGGTTARSGTLLAPGQPSPRLGMADTIHMDNQHQNRLIRVCMLIPSYEPLIGGAERQLSGLLPFIREIGVVPFVLTRRLKGTDRCESDGNVLVVRTFAPNSLLFLLSLGVYLVQHRSEWDLIHVHTLHSPVFMALVVGRLLGKPVVAKIPLSGPTAAITNHKRTWLGRLYLRFLVRNLAGFIILNQGSKSALLEIGVCEEKIFSIPNGVDAAKFHPEAPNLRTRLRQQHGLPQGFIGLFVGRLIPRKRPSLLVEAWSALCEEFPDALLVLVGGGADEARLREAVQTVMPSRVRMLGQQPSEVICGLLQAADCFILPSESEGLSNALLEAMAVGLPVVVSANDGNLEVVRDGENGLVFEQPKELIEALKRLIEDRDFMVQAGLRARQTVEEKYAFPVVARCLKDLYGQVLKTTGLQG
jgi:glycosyltransferase involved in cell wall biosynthesis